MSEPNILSTTVALFFDLILENKVEDLTQLITGECFEVLQQNLASTRPADSNNNSETLLSVYYKRKIFLGVDDVFWDIGIQTAFKQKNDCLGVLMDYSLAHSEEAAINFVFSVLDLVDVHSGTPDEQMFFDQLDDVFLCVPDKVVSEIFKLAHSVSLSDTRAGQYICSQWSNRLKNQLTDCGISTLGKKI